jgi:hypothetical protein
MTAIYKGSICLWCNCDQVFSVMTLAAAVHLGSLAIALAKICFFVIYYLKLDIILSIYCQNCEKQMSFIKIKLFCLNLKLFLLNHCHYLHTCFMIFKV